MANGNHTEETGQDANDKTAFYLTFLRLLNSMQYGLHSL
jgi:hypothetical protein